MTRQEVAELFDRVYKELSELREAGQKEYAHDEGNAFANFERVADRLGLSRDAVLLVYLLKHIDGITAFVRGHRSQREDVRGRIKDAIVYLHLLYGMIEEDEAGLSDPRILECSHAEVEVHYGDNYTFKSICKSCRKVLEQGVYGAPKVTVEI